MPESYQVNWSSKKQPFEVLANTNPYPVQVLSTLESNISTIVVNLPALFLNSNRYSIDFTVCTSNNTASLTQLFIRNNTDHYERVTLNSYLTPTSPFVYNNSWTNTCYTQTLSISPNICDAETNTNCNGQTDRTIDIGATFSGNGRIFVAGVTVNNMGDSSIYNYIYFLISRKLDLIQQDILNLSSSFDASIQESIDNDNKNHKEQMEQDQKNHDDLMNADADSSLKDKDTSSIDDYNKKDEELMSSIEVDTSDINFDVSSYSKVFKWVWDSITSFFQSSTKVFMAVTSILILSFVGLIIGRG